MQQPIAYVIKRGLEQLIRKAAKVRRQVNLRLSIAGILLTMADMRTNYGRDIVKFLYSLIDVGGRFSSYSFMQRKCLFYGIVAYSKICFGLSKFVIL